MSRRVVSGRRNPEGLPVADQVDRLRGLVSEIGGCRWAVGTTYRFASAFAERWADSVGLAGDVLFLAQRVDEDAPAGQRRIQPFPSAGVHAKTLLIYGPRGMVVQVSSANMTDNGMGGADRDVVWAQRVDRYSGPRSVAAGLADWLSSRLGKLVYQVPNQQLWERRLRAVRAKLKPVGKGSVEFLTNEEQPLAPQLGGAVGHVKAATVFSPFVHVAVAKQFACGDRVVVVPRDAERRVLQGKAVDLKALRPELRFFANDDGVFTHAKVYLLRGSRGAALAAGSANCTRSGLLQLAGSVMGSRRVRAESLILERLDNATARRIERQLRSRLEPADAVSLAVTNEFDDDEEKPTLLAWGSPAGHLCLLLIGTGRPDGLPVLRRHGRPIEKKLKVTRADDGGHAVASPTSDAWRSAHANGETGWSVQWGELSAQVTFLAEGDVADDVETLWGGAVGRGTRGNTDPPSKHKSRSGPAGERDQPWASLDEFERRSRLVAHALDSELSSPLPGREDQFRELWRKRRELV